MENQNYKNESIERIHIKKYKKNYFYKDKE